MHAINFQILNCFLAVIRKLRQNLKQEIHLLLLIYNDCMEMNNYMPMLNMDILLLCWMLNLG